MSGKVELKWKKVAVIAARADARVQGGAERFYVGLTQGFETIGCDDAY